MWFDLATDSLHRGREATDPSESRRWLDRASRIVPGDDFIALSLALACLNCGDVAAARDLFAPIAARWDLLEAWVGLATTAVHAKDWPAAVQAMQPVLSRHAIRPDTHGLAALVATSAGWPGWCAIDATGRLQVDGPADLFLDGVRIAPRRAASGVRIPPGRSLAVTRDGVALLGSPIDLQAVNAVEGFVAATAEGGLAGWAWHPNNPECAPVVEFRFADGSQSRVVAKVPIEQTEPDRPLARARQFAMSAEAIPTGLVEVFSGRPLWGSPIDPGVERRSAAGLEQSFTPVWADVVGPSVTGRPLRGPVDVVVPVYRGLRTAMACLDSVLPTLPDSSRLHVVDDGGSDSELAQALDGLAANGRIVLHRLPKNRGFPSAANTGLRAAGRRDVVLLNSDTVVPPGWLQHLADAAHSAPDIGSACPLSNDATILSYPKRNVPNPMPDPVPLSALARRANGLGTVDIPVAVGFCMYMRRDCLDSVGLLREDLWAQGYGEENDWCLRARHRGWRHVAAPGCFVAHEGGASFGAARRHLLARNGAQLERLHPGYGAMVADWIGRDPLGPARRRIDSLVWRTGRQQSAVVLVTHAAGGGVDRVVRERASALRAASVRPIVIRPDGDATVVGDGDTPNLRYRLPAEWDGLLRLLRTDRVARVELHHALGHSPDLLRLPEQLGVPYDVFVHDYASFCARIALVPEHSYCGEPPIAGCEACVADHGSNLEEEIGPAALVARSTLLLAGAGRVVAPAFDVATRIRRHFPVVLPAVTPWEEDNTLLEPPPTRRPIRHVCVIGGIGVEKGFEVLLGCVRDAAARSLPLRFTVVGYTADDERMLAAGPVFITGQYKEEDGEALIREQDADIALIPSVWPETWCFTLGLAWRAGLRAAVFDLGAPAERVRRTGWGDVLPLGMPSPTLNNWLLRHYAQPRTEGRIGRELDRTPSPSRQNPAI
jgi:GT2 family glycosyltransferase/glycosyltransferase involved in cell wall biosynthesis